MVKNLMAIIEYVIIHVRFFIDELLCFKIPKFLFKLGCVLLLRARKIFNHLYRYRLHHVCLTAVEQVDGLSLPQSIQHGSMQNQ